jgi:CheY-like chemotaxis protein/anti-sigma regulatory factor (Ser/Thr protein kinase)
LEKADWSVAFAGDGSDAIQRIAQQMPDIVLTDLQMPNMNGLEFVSAVKSEYPLVPVILMTAHGSEDIAAQALRLGAAGYVPKKRLAEDLLPTVERVLTSAREERAHSRLMHYITHAESVFVLPNDLRLIRSLASYLQLMLRSVPLGDETERLRVGIAVEEALLNALYHGNLQIGATLKEVDHEAISELAERRACEAPYRDRRIHVRAKVSRCEAVYVVRDEGPGFDHSQLLGPADLGDPDRSAHRGIILMRAIMDEVIYNEAGNEVTLIKRPVPETAAPVD